MISKVIKDRLEDLKYRFFSVKTDVLSVIESIKRSYDYAKFGYSNPDWDWEYAQKLYIWKLKRLQNCIANGWSSDRYKYAQKLEEVINGIDYHLENVPLEFAREKDKLWQEVKNNIKFKQISSKGREKWGKYKKFISKIEAKKKRELRKAYKILSDNIEDFWD